MKFLYHIAVFLIMLFWQLVANGQVDATARLDTNDVWWAISFIWIWK